MRKHIHIASIVSLSLSTFLIILMGIWTFYPYKTVDILNQPYIVENKVVKQGDFVNYVIDYCKYTDKVAIVDKQFIDGLIYVVPNSNLQLESGCHKQIVSVKVPKNLPTGEYCLKITTTFQMNLIRNITKTYHTEKFVVIK